MNPPELDIKKSMIYGIAVLVPVSVLFLALMKLVDILERIAKALHLSSNVGALVAVILAIVLLILLCFIIGTVVRTRIGARPLERLENTVLKQIPGFEIIVNVLHSTTTKV
jgi:uncharacterized membrane protein